VRVLVGIPSAGSPATPFAESLAALAFPKELTAIDRYVATGNFVPAQRELIVERAIATNADVLLMCDDDMILPNDAFTSLLSVLSANARCALAGALYYSRDGFRPMVVSDWDPLDTTTAIIPAFERAPVEVGGVGFGCVAIRIDAVRELEPPYFASHVYLEPRLGKARVCDEDYLFCHRLRGRSWSVVLHAGVRAGHYDRATNTTHPLEWEPLERTRVPRIAAIQDGVVQLIPAAENAVPSRGEYHQRVSLEYITPKE
jgi:GT2 family glycosyltransferase